MFTPKCKGAIIKLVLDFIKNISPTELILIAVVIFLLFGTKVLIGLSRKLGEFSKQLKTIKEGVA